MPGLAGHSSLKFVKALYLGDPGSGKTGSLDALVGAGYTLRIYDLDNLLGSLTQYVLRNHPSSISNVSYQTFTDKMEGKDLPVVMVGGGKSGGYARVAPFTKGTPDAYIRCLKQLTRWRTEDEDFGDPGTWGEDTVVVIDSLTSLSQAAYRYAMAMNPMAMDGRTYYGTAQALILNLLMLLFSEQMAVNVIVIAHIDYRENQLEIIKGFPRTVGEALNSQVGGYFNSIFMAQTQGDGKHIKRTIKTNSTGIVNLKNPISFKIDDELPLETGLATIFETITGHKPNAKLP